MLAIAAAAALLTLGAPPPVLADAAAAAVLAAAALPPMLADGAAAALLALAAPPPVLADAAAAAVLAVAALPPVFALLVHHALAHEVRRRDALVQITSRRARLQISSQHSAQKDDSREHDFSILLLTLTLLLRRGNAHVAFFVAQSNFGW